MTNLRLNKLEKFYPLIIILAGFFLFFPSLGFDFTYDDGVQIKKNPYILESNSFQEIIAIFTEPTYPGDLYRPLTLLSIKANYLLSGLDPLSYHFINIILHCLASLLMLVWLQKLGVRSHLAMLGSLIFTVHPIHIEAIANIYNRSEILVAIFGLSSLILFQDYLQQRRLLVLLGSMICLMLAVLSKESALTIAGVLILVAIINYLQKQPEKQKIRDIVAPIIAIGFCSASYVAIRALILESFMVKVYPHLFLVENPLGSMSFFERIIPSGYILGEYLRILLLPLKLSADYSLPKKYFDDLLQTWPGHSAVLIAAGFLALTTYLIYRRAGSAFWCIWILVTFSLTINLLVPIGTFIADRLAYLPSIGFCMLVAILLTCAPYRRFLIPVYLFFLIIQTTFRLPVWRNDLALFEQTVLDNTASPKAAFNLAARQYFAGFYELSVENYKDALFRDPTFIDAGKFIMNSYAHLGNWHAVRYWGYKYLEVKPGDPDVIKFLRLVEAKFLPPVASKPAPTVSAQ